MASQRTHSSQIIQEKGEPFVSQRSQTFPRILGSPAGIIRAHFENVFRTKDKN